MIRLFYRQPHYRDHLEPIWAALPDDLKLKGPMERFDRLLIAGGPDVVNGHPYVYVEHGAGQTYRGVSVKGYAGGEHHQECKLFICPNERVADRWRARYPDTPAVAVGCPKLDVWHRPDGPRPESKTLAITFHFDLNLVPETRSAFPFYKAGLPRMVESYREQGWTVYGHAHPRYESVLKPYWARIGVTWTENALRDASVLIADNTSLQAEFLSCGRPVVALNAPWYRRDVHHGERFWAWDLTHVDDADGAASLALDDLSVPSEHPYAYADGLASQRAAHAISAVLRSQ